VTATVIDRKPSAVQLRIEIPWEEMLPHAEIAARRLSKTKSVNGFRAGNAPYWAVARDLGAMAVLEEALSDAIPATLGDTLIQEKLETVGEPSIQVEMLAPDNPTIYTASVLLLPEVTVGDISKITCKSQSTSVAAEDVDHVMEELRTMQATEQSVDRPAGPADAVTIDLTMNLGGVPIEGGSAKGNVVYLYRTHYVPGFPEQLVGMKKREEKEFQLEFPKEHFQKHLAGKMIDFKVTMIDVRQRILPEPNDALALRVGQSSLEKLRERIHTNLAIEKEQKETDRYEQELLRCILEKTRFSEIPDFLVTREAQRMVTELEESVSRDGGVFNDYLQHIGKTRPQLLLDVASKALERVKSALLLRHLAQQQNISVPDEDVAKDIERTHELYAKNQEVLEALELPRVREQVRLQLRNKKVLEWLKGQVRK